MANDSTVKAGSWGKRTVEKIIRIQETALKLEIPILYLVDSAGARITDQIEMFPGRRGAGRIFHNQIKLSGRVPQVCLLFGPSAAGGAYIPAFCDVVVMVDGNPDHIITVLPGEDATCAKGGLTEGSYCSECGKVLTIRQPIDKIPHTYNQTVISPTCTTNGYTVYACECGNIQQGNYVAAFDKNGIQQWVRINNYY